MPAEAGWWRDAVLYHLYVRSFADSDGDGIGDLRGVLGHLDHLAALGVDAVWLSPFYPSPQRDFGYDIADHLGVDPVYGTADDLAELVAALHRRGLRVLVDLVLNHTSTEHPWFVESRAGRDSPKRDWYFWRPPAPDGGPPNNWLSAFRSQGAAWTYDEATGDYYLSTFTPYQADLDLRNPAVRAAMWDVVRTWLDRGIDGFRVDVAHRVMKDPLLRDNPAEVALAQRHVSHPSVRQHNFDHEDTYPLLAELRELIDRHGGASVGEVPIHDHRRLARYYGTERPGLHMVFTFGLWDLPWKAAAFRAEVAAVEASLPPGGWPCYSLANHDIPRVLDKYDEDGRGDARARVAAVLLLTCRGTPCVYYGEEIGLRPAGPVRGADVDGRDPSRIPMRWDPSGGFSTAEPWLPYGADPATRNVAVQAADPGSLLSLHRRLIALRRSSAALRRGSYAAVPAPDGVFAYRREDGPDRLLVALNFTGDEQVLDAAGEPVLSTLDGVVASGRTVVLRPDEAVILRA